MFSDICTNLNRSVIDSLYAFENELLSKKKSGTEKDPAYIKYEIPPSNNFLNRLTAIPVDIVGITLHCLTPLWKLIDSAVCVPINLIASVFCLLTLNQEGLFRHARATYVNLNIAIKTILLAPIDIAEALAFAPSQFLLTLISPRLAKPLELTLHGRSQLNEYSEPVSYTGKQHIEEIQTSLYQSKDSDVSITRPAVIVVSVVDAALEIIKEYATLVSSVANGLRSFSLITKQIAMLPLTIFSQIAVGLWNPKSIAPLYTQNRQDQEGDITYTTSSTGNYLHIVKLVTRKDEQGKLTQTIATSSAYSHQQ